VLYPPNTGAKNPTLATANMIKIKRLDIDIAAKYIPASLVTVSRMFDAFTPWRLAMSRVCTRTDTRTTMSEGTDMWFNLRNGKMRRSDRVLTKEEREGTLNEWKGFVNGKRDETHVIRIQRDLRYFSCWKYPLNYEIGCVCVMGWKY